MRLRHLLAAILLGAPLPARAADYDVVEKTIPELQAALQQGAVTSRRLVELYLARIEAYDRRGPALRAMIRLNPRALEQAAALDRERATRGPRGPLHGIPLVIKDNFDTADMPTSAGSLALATLAPREDAFQVRRLREAGAVILGKTNLHELASGITSISSLGGQTRNPYDPSRNPGGSSGGTGAAVAASLAAAGMGSDTCGSIRIPAAHNNLVGLRSSLGAASRAGIVPLSHTQDVGGPLARSTTDLAILLDATVGPDPGDPITAQSAARLPPRSFQDALRPERLKGARIGVLKALFGDAPEDEEVAAVLRKALETMQKQGAETPEVQIPGLAELLRESSVIDSEFKFDLADYLARVPGAPVRSLPEILERGLYDAALEAPLRRRAAVEKDSEAYRKALIKRRATLELVLAAFEEQRLTALLYPTLRRKPAAIGEPQRGSNCQLSATTGLPALSLPAGFSDDGLPVGLELLGTPWSDARLLALAHSFERASPQRRAPSTTPPLLAGKAPAPVAFEAVAIGEGRATLKARFTFDETTGVLAYTASVSGVTAGEVLAASLHRGGAGKDGAALERLLGNGESSGAGSLTLQPRDREELRAGRLYLRLYTRGHPLGAARAPLTLP